MLFGLIMTLTFTLGAGIIIEEEGREGARQLLIAAIGCNIAWGIIDGALYLVGHLFDRGRIRALGLAVRQAPTVPSATKHVAGELDQILAPVTTDAERAALYGRIAENLRSNTVVAGNRLGKEEWMGAWASFWLVFLTSLPAAAPFLLIDDAQLALRVSNGVLLTLLFATGYCGRASRSASRGSSVFVSWPAVSDSSPWQSRSAADLPRLSLPSGHIRAKTASRRRRCVSAGAQLADSTLHQLR